MSLMLYVVVALGGAVLTLAARRWHRPARLVGITGLVATSAAALTIEPGQVVDLGGSVLATTDYLRDFMLLGSIVGLGLGVSGVLAGTRRDAPATTMAVLAAGALTLGLRDPLAAVLVATAGGLVGILVTVAPDGGPIAAGVGIRQARIVIVAGVLGVAATAWTGIGSRAPVDLSVVLALAYLGFGVAVAMRFGAIPFHLWAARLADTVPETALPVLTAIAPATLALVALAWIDADPLLATVRLEPVRLVLLGIAVASIVLAAVAAFVQDEIEHILGYSIMADAGVVILALAAIDADAWAPGRTWILVFVASRCAFAGWAAGIRVGFWTGSLDDLRGWVRHAPILGAVLVAVIVASVGLPGWAAFDARRTIVDLAIGGPLGALVLLATLAPIAYYGRLLAIGLRRPDPVARPIDDWQPRIPRFDRADILGWIRTTVRINRSFSAAAVAVILAGLAIATSAGAFGQTAAGSSPSSSVQPFGSSTQRSTSRS